MARPLRTLLPGIPAHVVQRGNNRLRCFFDDNDRRFYLAQLAELSAAFECALHAYVLMDNHVHLLLTPSKEDSISLLMKNLGQRFVQFINREHQRTGALWEGRYYSSVIDTGAYLFSCHRYIEMNPVRAKMVPHPAHFAWSSYRSNACGNPDLFLTPHAAYLALGSDPIERARVYQMLFELSLGDGAIEALREATRGGYAFGSEAFIQRAAQASGRPMAPRRRAVAVGF
jgi:putative transposase